MTKVLISPGYGAGWSTWCSGSKEFTEFLLKDATLVEMAENGASEDDVEAYIKSKFPDEYCYTGGWDQIKVIDISEGTMFRVKEYDGHESIEFCKSVNWSIA